ncbi:MAG: hypothetical protein AAF639_26785 [Chloroflexota bacterium]
MTQVYQNHIQKIIDQYPIDTGQCRQCARGIYDLLTAEGFDAQIGYMETDTRFLSLADGRQLSRRPRRSNSLAYHVFVQVDNIVYDAVTGASGMAIEAYKALFYEDVFKDKTIRLTYYEYWSQM